MLHFVYSAVCRLIYVYFSLNFSCYANQTKSCICSEFEVESLNFPGQQHRWKLSQLLQKGTERTRDSLLNDMALALRFLFVTAKGRLVSHFFSVSQALKGLLVGFLRIFDILIGIPSLQAHNLDTKIREERCKYLVAELVCRVRFRNIAVYLFIIIARKVQSTGQIPNGRKA